MPGRTHPRSEEPKAARSQECIFTVRPILLPSPVCLSVWEVLCHENAMVHVHAMKMPLPNGEKCVKRTAKAQAQQER